MDIKKIASIANKLDGLGLTKEADILDSLITKIAEGTTEEPAYTPSYAALPSGADIAAKMQAEERLKAIKEKVKIPTLSGDPAKPLKVVTHGPPEKGFPLGRPYYAAKPESINQFKEFLSAVLTELGFSYKLLQNGKWDIKADDIRDAFKKFAELAGAPEAGLNWTAWANKSNVKEYTPNMEGILNFWKNNIDSVYSKYVLPKLVEEEKKRNQEEISGLKGTIVRDSIPAGVALPTSGPTESPKGETMLPKKDKSDKDKKDNLTRLAMRLHAYVCGGVGIEIGAPGEKFFSTLTGQVMTQVKQAISADSEAAAWFSQSPEKIIPDENIKKEDYLDIYTGNNNTIASVYEFIQEASNAARERRKNNPRRRY